jgi:hypothetical protein
MLYREALEVAPQRPDDLGAGRRGGSSLSDHSLELSDEHGRFLGLMPPEHSFAECSRRLVPVMCSEPELRLDDRSERLPGTGVAVRR